MTDLLTTPAELISLVYDDLGAWAGGNHGACSLTQSPYDLVNMLGQSPTGWRLIIHWAGEKPADPRVREGAVMDNAFRFILDGSLGLTAVPRIGLIKQTSARAPFLALADAVRQRVMAYRFPWLAKPNSCFWYEGTDDAVPLPEGLMLAAYNLKFNLRSVVAMPATPIALGGSS